MRWIGLLVLVFAIFLVAMIIPAMVQSTTAEAANSSNPQANTTVAHSSDMLSYLDGTYSWLGLILLSVAILSVFRLI